MNWETREEELARKAKHREACIRLFKEVMTWSRDDIIRKDIPLSTYGALIDGWSLKPEDEPLRLQAEAHATSLVSADIERHVNDIRECFGHDGDPASIVERVNEDGTYVTIKAWTALTNRHTSGKDFIVWAHKHMAHIVLARFGVPTINELPSAWARPDASTER